MKVNRVLSKKEVDELVKKAGREPQKRESESLKGLDDYKIINDVFNACLQDQIDGKLPTNYVYQIGMPSECLLKAGISNLPKHKDSHLNPVPPPTFLTHSTSIFFHPSSLDLWVGLFLLAVC